MNNEQLKINNEKKNKKIEAFKDKLFKAAKERGFADCEIYFANGSSFSVKVFEGELREYKNAGDAGLSFRGLYNGKMGYAYSEKIEDDVIPFLVENAAQNAEIIEDADIEDLFAGSGAYPSVKTYESSLSGVSAAEKIDLALRMEKAAKNADKRVESVDYCGLETGENETFIMNTLGLNVSEKSNYMSAYSYPRVRGGEQVKMNGDVWMGKYISEFDPEYVGKRSAEISLSYLGAKSVPTKKYKVIFTGEAMSPFLETFIGVFYAENVQKGFSLLKDKIGTKIAADIVNIRDDALLPDKPGSAAFDSEGVAAKNKSVIENGVLKTFLHNRKTAAKDGVEPTGNGFKPSFKSPVGISATNFYIVPSDKSQDDLIKEMGGGLVISEIAGFHSGTNDVSGDFSLSAEGYVVENGKKTGAVEQITIAGNYFTLLKEITAVGSDIRWLGGVCSPSVAVRELSVSGL